MTLRLLGCVVLAALSAFAQSDRGTLTGTVADPAGAVVASAQMEIRNVETGATYQAASTDTGNYTMPQLPVGSYELTVTVPGFKKYVRQGIVIQVAQTLRLDVGLEVGAVSDSVTVTGETTMLKTESAELSHVVPVQRLQDLPILAIGGAASSSQGLRFYLAQTQLIPGTSYSNGVNSVRVNGAPNGTFRTQIEGMDATNALIPFSAASLQPSIDAVEETNIQTSNYAAEFGQVGGGLFNITMRSGTN
ncbi:MAG: carboxypeptidase-like regulatory domain-containing protein, partial [Acidobacteriota bacterium]